MSIFRMAERLSGRWPDSQGFCGVRDFDEPQVYQHGPGAAGVPLVCRSGRAMLARIEKLGDG